MTCFKRILTACAIIGAKVNSLVDIRDIHVYGGIALAAIGIMALSDWRFAMLAAGSILFFLGIRRVK